MRNKVRIHPSCLLLILSLFILSWGKTGHRKIGSGTALFLPGEMEQFSHWPGLLSAHGSDADYRKGSDPGEGPKHYIDIDNYPEFIATGRIPGTLDSLYMSHHPEFIAANGYLPWATETAYDSLVDCFVRGDWDRALLFAADLGHYIGDAHMPLHLTRNYDGQFSGNSGIHSRYESAMIGAYAAEIKFEGDTIRFIEDVNEYIFEYLYSNYTYVDSVLAADDYATGLAGNTWSEEYTAALWEKTRSFTIPLFRNASRNLTELIFTAWAEAGKPSMDASGYENHQGEALPAKAARGDIRLDQNHPNPFGRSTSICFHLPGEAHVSLFVLDETGRLVERLLDENCPAGENRLEWHPGNLPAGNYYLVIRSRDSFAVRKMIRYGD